MLKTTLGAHLTEILNEGAVAKESGVSRRRVVAGVAWTVPVILTTVAAPPASASPGPTPTATFSTAFDGPVLPISIARHNSNGVGTARSGEGPTKLIVQNASGPVSGSIIVAPTGALDSRVWVGVKTLGPNNATLGATTFGAAHTSTTTYSLTGSQSAEYPITFQYLDDSKPGPVAGQVTFTVTVTVNGSEVRGVYPALKMTVS